MKTLYFFLGTFLFIFNSFTSCKDDPPLQITENKKEIIDKYLVVSATDRSYDIDGKTSISIVNKSEDYIFEIGKIGVAQENVLGNRTVAFPRVNAVLKPQSSLHIDVPISHGVKVRTAYALLDNVIIRPANE